MEKGKIEYRSENVGNIRDQERFSRILEDVIVERRLEAAGFDSKRVRDLSTDVDVKTIKVSSKGEEKESVSAVYYKQAPAGGSKEAQVYRKEDHDAGPEAL